MYLYNNNNNNNIYIYRNKVSLSLLTSRFFGLQHFESSMISNVAHHLRHDLPEVVAIIVSPLPLVDPIPQVPIQESGLWIL
jgi:hypothetical protein